VFCTQHANVLKVSKARPVALSAGEDLRIPATGLVCVLTTANAIATMEEPRIWDGVVETVQFLATEDLPPYVHCTESATRSEGVPAPQDSGLLIAA